MIAKIKRLDLRQIWKNEATDFTTWLEGNLDVLSSELGFGLSLLKREHQVGSFSVDLLAEDDYGHKVIIENQLEKTDHGHLGQIITYCSNLEAKTCIWVAKEPRQEHVNAVNWLNRETSLNFYLLKVEAISIDGSKPAALFQIICKPDEEIRSASVAEAELSDRGRFNIEFWTEMNKKCEGKLPGFTGRKPSKYHFHGQAIGQAGFTFSFLAGSKYYGVEVYIDTTDIDINKHLFAQLQEKKALIESEFGHSMEFDPIPDKRACRIKYVIGEGDVMDLDRNKVQEDLIKYMQKLERVFKPKIKELSYDLEQVA